MHLNFSFDASKPQNRSETHEISDDEFPRLFRWPCRVGKGSAGCFFWNSVQFILLPFRPGSTRRHLGAAPVSLAHFSKRRNRVPCLTRCYILDQGSLELKWIDICHLENTASSGVSTDPNPCRHSFGLKKREEPAIIFTRFDAIGARRLRLRQSFEGEGSHEGHPPIAYAHCH